MTAPTRRSALIAATAIASAEAGHNLIDSPRRKTAPVFAPVLVPVISGEWRRLVKTGQGPCELKNRDPLIPVFIGAEGSDPTGRTVGILDPLGSQRVDGAAAVWGITLSGTAMVNVIPGGLGSQVSPEQIAQQLQPAILIADTGLLGAGTTPIVTFTKAGRIWGLTLTYSIATASTFSGGPASQSGSITSSSLGVVLIKSMLIAAANQNLSETLSPELTSAIPVPAGDILNLNVGSVASGVQVAFNGIVYYSTP